MARALQSVKGEGPQATVGTGYSDGSIGLHPPHYRAVGRFPCRVNGYLLVAEVRRGLRYLTYHLPLRVG
jgi:hypothetical protein